MKTSIYTIGRDPACDIPLDPSCTLVSREHARFVQEGNDCYIIDLSRNGTFVNGMRIAPGEPYPVVRGDNISFANEVYLDWRDIPKRSGKIWTIVGVSAGALLLIALAILAGVMLGNRNVRESDEERQEWNTPAPGNNAGDVLQADKPADVPSSATRNPRKKPPLRKTLLPRRNLRKRLRKRRNPPRANRPRRILPRRKTLRRKRPSPLLFFN